MEAYETESGPRALRWALRGWNWLCLALGGACLLAGIALIASSTGGSIGDGVGATMGGMALFVVIVVAAVWALGRELLIAGWRVARRLAG